MIGDTIFAFNKRTKKVCRSAMLIRKWSNVSPTASRGCHNITDHTSLKVSVTIAHQFGVITSTRTTQEEGCYLLLEMLISNNMKGQLTRIIHSEYPFSRIKKKFGNDNRKPYAKILFFLCFCFFLSSF